jgi:hypothetical protein
MTILSVYLVVAEFRLADATNKAAGAKGGDTTELAERIAFLEDRLEWWKERACYLEALPEKTASRHKEEVRELLDVIATKRKWIETCAETFPHEAMAIDMMLDEDRAKETDAVHNPTSQGENLGGDTPGDHRGADVQADA